MPNTVHHFLPKHTEMGSTIASFDWAKTDLGLISDWPPNLKTTVNIILNSPVPMVVLWGKQGIMIYNDAYSIFAGARHPELLGCQVLKGWPEVADFNRTVMEHGLAGKQLSYKDQQLTLHRNGAAEAVWMDLNYSPIADDQGVPAGVLAIVVETTKRITAEQKQQAAEAAANLEREKLQNMLTRAPAYIAVVHGPQHIYTLTNKMYKELIGKRNVVGKPIRQALPEVEPTGLFDVLDEIFKSGKPYVGSEMLVGLDRRGTGTVEPGYFDFVFQPIVNKDGAVTDIFMHGVEVTQQINTRHKLSETKRMFDALFDSTIVAIAMADMAGNILQANKTFLKLFGYTRADFKKGMTSKQVTPPSSYHVTESIYNSLRQTGEAEPTAKTYVRKDGREFPALAGAAMLPHSKNRFMSFILDMSELEKLKESNQIKDEFVALASHQLRTPATSVKQYLGILLEGYAGIITNEQRKFLQTANDANERQLGIINDLLKTAQIDANGFRLQLQACDIVKIAKQTMAHYVPVTKSKQQTCSLKTSMPKIVANVDATEMSICIANLIENASKYSAENTAITLDIKKTAHHIRLAITDQGVGISIDDQDKIFDKFTRVDNVLSDTVNGNGLGLYMVQRIISLHKGTITVQSAIGKGTTFVIELPV